MIISESNDFVLFRKLSAIDDKSLTEKKDGTTKITSMRMIKFNIVMSLKCFLSVNSLNYYEIRRGSEEKKSGNKFGKV